MSDIIEPPKGFLQKIADALQTGFAASGCCVEPPAEVYTVAESEAKTETPQVAAQASTQEKG